MLQVGSTTNNPNPNANVVNDALGLGVATPLGKPAYDLYSGQIGAWTMRTHSDPLADIVREGQLIGETYRYDVLGRLRSVTTHKDDQGTLVAEAAGGWSSAYKYDPHGNIIRLNRRGKVDDATSQIVDDANIVIGIAKNVIVNVVDPFFDQIFLSNEVQAIVAGRSQVDAEGKTTDLSEASTESKNQFNSEDLPLSIVRKNASTTFIYDASGLVVRQDVVTNSDVTERFYLIPADATTDRAVYKKTEAGSPTIREWSIIAPRTRLDYTLNKFFYQLTIMSPATN